MEIKEITNENDYNLLDVDKNAPLTQAWFYGDWQKNMNRKVHRFIIEHNSKIIGYFQLIVYPFMLGFSHAYIPYGPVFQNDPNIETLTALKDFLKRWASQNKTAFIRFDATPHINKEIGEKLFATPSQKTYLGAHLQPRAEWRISLIEQENELLEKMHEKMRYNIRLAEKKGVTVEIIERDFSKHFDDFYKLLQSTAQREHFSLHPKSYYQHIFTHCDKLHNAFLANAKFNNNVIASNFIVTFGQSAVFLFGGSDNEYRNVMAPHKTHWEAMRYAKNKGLKWYNMGGITLQGYEHKGLEGVSSFKEKFGGEIFLHSDFYDLIINPILYQLYTFRKKLS